MFLSCPRRFGKSLLLSTIEYLFQGKTKLFEGLYIQNKWDWNERYPVIRIDFSLDIREITELHEVIYNELRLNKEFIFSVKRIR